METRANYVATGAFVLLVLVGIVGAALWLAGTQVRSQDALFETRISGSVNGLNLDAPVRLNGIDIGRVGKIQQDPQDPGVVVLLLEIRRDARIHADAAASLEMQGLTGGRYVELSGGTPGSPMLAAAVGQPYPRIASRPSPFDVVMQDAPELASRLVVVADRLQALLDERNRQAVSATLANVRDLTGVLDERSHDFDRLLADGGETMRNLAAASAELNTLVQHLDRSAAGADGLIVSAKGTSDRVARLATDLDTLVQASRPGVRDLTDDVPARLDALLANANRLAESLDRVSRGLERDPSRILFGAREEGYRPK
jgi:phospholipid/cholesterol/gamma-HCH transport system substrate-binding protein